MVNKSECYLNQIKSFLDNKEDISPNCQLVVCTLGSEGSILVKKDLTRLFPINESEFNDDNILNKRKIPIWLEYLSNLHTQTHNFPISLTYSNQLGSEYQIIK